MSHRRSRALVGECSFVALAVSRICPRLSEVEDIKEKHLRFYHIIQNISILEVESLRRADPDRRALLRVRTDRTEESGQRERLCGAASVQLLPATCGTNRRPRAVPRRP